MIKRIPSEEIQKLKRTNFWLCRDRTLTKKIMREKSDAIVEVNKQMSSMEYSKLKEYTKKRNKLLDEHDLLIDLYIRINEDIYQNGKEIMKLRGCKR